jgi:hypothetical protein
LLKNNCIFFSLIPGKFEKSFKFFQVIIYL